MMNGVYFFFVLLLTGVCSNTVVGDTCIALDGSCNWTDEVHCDQPEKYCGRGSLCYVVTKSINSSYPLTPSFSTLLAMCRCSSQETGCATSGSAHMNQRQYECNHNLETIQTSEPKYNDSYVEVYYARMWSTTYGTAPNCGNTNSDMRYKYLPNILALTRFWCQQKYKCAFNTSKIWSFIGNSELLEQEFSFEWTYGHLEANVVIHKCGLNHYFDEATRSCYAITPLTSSWNKARAECLRQGGDLAHFKEENNFMDILRHFNPSLETTPTNQSTAISIWFKWYSWDGDQRKVQEFGEVAERFACEIYDVGPLPDFARCHSPSPAIKAQGLCVLPPMSLDSSLPQYQELKCPAKVVNVNGYPTLWNATDAGTTVQLTCPGNFTGMMYWKCGSDGQWMSPVPDSSGCSNPVVTESINNANQQLESGQDPAETLVSLSKEINSTTLASGNLRSLDVTIKLAISKQEELLENTIDPGVKELSSKNFTASMTDLSDVIFSSLDAFWGLDFDERLRTMDSIQKNIENSLIMMATNLLSEPTYHRKDRTLTIEAENRRRANYNDSGYFISANSVDHFLLPPGFQFLVEEIGGKIQLSFVAYTEFPELLHGDSLALFEDEWLVTQDSPENRPESLKEIVNTLVLGATLGQGNVSIFLGGNLVDVESCIFDGNGYVEIGLKTLNSKRYQISNRRCVFWDVTSQFWSDEGCCMVPNTDATLTQCRCNHLTNFAVIMDINGLFANKSAPALDYITVIGGSISIVCLTIAICIFFWVRTLRKEFRYHIHRNLCLSLVLAETLMLIGLEATQNSAMCITIAVFLHLLFLCAFGWMLVEGLFLYFLITKVFHGGGLNNWQAYMIGYGLPVLIVSITLAATKVQAYIPNEGATCWINAENGAIWAFAGPVAAVIMVNVLFLMMALLTTCKVQRENRDKGKRQGTKLRQIFGAFSLTYILGITWICGFLYFNESTIALAYIFTVFNSLQGFFIFLALCVLNKQVRTDFIRQLLSTEMVQRVARFFNVDIINWRSKSHRSTQRTNTGSSLHHNTRTTSNPRDSYF